MIANRKRANDDSKSPSLCSAPYHQEHKSHRRRLDSDGAHHQATQSDRYWTPGFDEQYAAEVPKYCHSCFTTDTPEWRKGPRGPRTLCNACGLIWAKLSRNQRGDSRSSKMYRSPSRSSSSNTSSPKQRYSSALSTSSSSSSSPAPAPPSREPSPIDDPPAAAAVTTATETSTAHHHPHHAVNKCALSFLLS